MIVMDLTACPECGHPAEIEWRTVLESTDGPIEHARVSCVRRHWFLLPVERLSAKSNAIRSVTEPLRSE